MKNVLLAFLSLIFLSGMACAQEKEIQPFQPESKTRIVRQGQGIPLSELSGQMGMELVCKDGFVRVNNSALQKIVIQGKASSGAVTNAPVRCQGELYFLDIPRN